mmetsp:Transcript_5903/g.17619  ORF Transcript_5903/g.17619 Transcript_5903/m.17619 type:complete len:202 (-) Transcript_5903:271-876(-)
MDGACWHTRVDPLCRRQDQLLRRHAGGRGVGLSESPHHLDEQDDDGLCSIKALLTSLSSQGHARLKQRHSQLKEGRAVAAGRLDKLVEHLPEEEGVRDQVSQATAKRSDLCSPVIGKYGCRGSYRVLEVADRKEERHKLQAGELCGTRQHARAHGLKFRSEVGSSRVWERTGQLQQWRSESIHCLHTPRTDVTIRPSHHMH